MASIGRYRRGGFKASEVLPLLDILFEVVRLRRRREAQSIGEKADVLFTEYVYRRDRVRTGVGKVLDQTIVHRIEGMMYEVAVKNNMLFQWAKIERITQQQGYHS